MRKSSESGKLQITHLLGIVASIAVGLGVAYWYFTMGGKKTTEELEKKAERIAEEAKAAAAKDTKDANDKFDASRARQTEKRTGGLLK